MQIHVLQTNNADPYQFAASEADLSGSALLAKTGHNRVQQDQGYHLAPY